jgi:hypothetical protein
MAAIELASTEGFTRPSSGGCFAATAGMHYSLSPLMKGPFNRFMAHPIGADVFAEVGEFRPEADLFLRVEMTVRLQPTAPPLRRHARISRCLAGHGNRESRWKHSSKRNMRRAPVLKRR